MTHGGSQDISMYVTMGSSSLFPGQGQGRWANASYYHSFRHHYLIDSKTSSLCNPNFRTDNELLGNDAM